MVGCSGLRCGARRPRSGPKPRGSSVSLREAVGLFAPEAGDRGERRRDPRAMDDAASRACVLRPPRLGPRSRDPGRTSARPSHREPSRLGLLRGRVRGGASRPSGSAGSSCETAGRLGDGQLGRRDRRGHGGDQDDPRTRTQDLSDQGPCPSDGADTDTFTPVDRKDAIRSAGLDPRCQYVVFIGLFAPWVDFDVMLTAFAEVGGTRPDARLVLVGDGAERPRVNALIDELDLGDRVLSTGFVAEQERVRPHRRSDRLPRPTPRGTAHG